MANEAHAIADDLLSQARWCRMILPDGHADAVLIRGYWMSGEDAWVESDAAFKKRIQEVLGARQNCGE
jgi:hypothetical protein